MRLSSINIHFFSQYNLKIIGQKFLLIFLTIFLSSSLSVKNITKGVVFWESESRGESWISLTWKFLLFHIDIFILIKSWRRKSRWLARNGKLLINFHEIIVTVIWNLNYDAMISFSCAIKFKNYSIAWIKIENETVKNKIKKLPSLLFSSHCIG